MWNTTTSKPLRTSVSDDGCIRLSLEETKDHVWQFMLIAFGETSDKLHAECLTTWPREAIRIAREKLDAFEASLEGE
jgi:hypothetical protein